MKRNRQLAFEQNCLRTLRTLETRPRRLLVACSGGIDSMVLLEVLFRLRNSLQFEIFVAHIHHGKGNSPFRMKAWKLVKQETDKKGLPFISNSQDGKSTEKVRKSEADLREFRWTQLKQMQVEVGADAIAVAHHYSDLLETRLMRLIRGTGAIGISGMSLFDKRLHILRPLLMVEKAHITEYAKILDVPFVDDPSNKKTDAFRNWIRKWLKQLDRKQPNGVRNLARSLGDLVEQLAQSQNETRPVGLTDSGIDRRVYLIASRAHRRQHLARYCHEMGMKNYTQGHIEELIKRLDARKKEFTFEMLQCVWSVTPDRIKASRSTGRV